MKSFSEIWNKYPLKWKILIIFIAMILIGLSTRSIVFTILAWIFIIYLVIKTLMDFELF